ncbi:MAG: UDP-N-acetylglucosamine 2-epimerase (non-hydrolyzing) [Clostridia bacterium]
MKRIKIMPVLGTRPDAVKMAPLVKELERMEAFDVQVCATGQHREMLKQVLDVFGISPRYDLGIMRKSQTLEYITHSILEKLGHVLETNPPDMVLVHGDTATCFVSALAAFYKKIPVGHVEAGLRTYDRYSPFPEEMNRTLTSKLASLHFAPTLSNRENLLKEGIPENTVHVTGNTVIDALKTTVSSSHVFECKALNQIDYKKNRVITLTAHRRENLGQPLVDICRGVVGIARDFPDVLFVYPVHLNHAVQETVMPMLRNYENILLTEPVNVMDLHNLMARSYMVMTDSGGLQEEAPALGKPVLVLRRETERPEAVAAGTVKLTGTGEQAVYADAKILLTDSVAYADMAHATNPYGDGHASERIVRILLEYFNRA